MARLGRQPQLGLAPRICVVCGANYQPYRAAVRACSKVCYRKLPDVRAKDSAHKALPAIRERKNLVRRIEVNPARREVNLRQSLRALYGVTLEEYRAMLAAQDGKCAICGKPPTEGGIKAASRLHVDHHHATKANRGLLCSRCNRGIGFFGEDPALFQAAVDYLRRYL